MKIKLDPCPFCGGKRPRMCQSEPEECGDTIWYFIRCSRQSCMACGPMFGQYAMFPNNQEELAVQAWNTRVSMKPQTG